MKIEILAKDFLMPVIIPQDYPDWWDFYPNIFNEDNKTMTFDVLDILIDRFVVIVLPKPYFTKEESLEDLAEEITWCLNWDRAEVDFESVIDLNNSHFDKIRNLDYSKYSIWMYDIQYMNRFGGIVKFIK